MRGARTSASGAKRLYRPGEAVGQIAHLDGTASHQLMETQPLLANVRRRGPLIEQIIELEGIALEIVELVVEPGSVESEKFSIPLIVRILQEAASSQRRPLGPRPERAFGRQVRRRVS